MPQQKPPYQKRIRLLRKAWKGGELFDVEFGARGELIFVEIKK